MERMSRKEGTMLASAVPSKKRTTKRPAKLLQAMWRYMNPALQFVSGLSACSINGVYQIVRFKASHLPTGNLWSAQFCGHSARRYPR